MDKQIIVNVTKNGYLDKDGSIETVLAASKSLHSKVRAKPRGLVTCGAESITR